MQLPIPVIKLLSDFVEQEEVKRKQKKMKRRERMQKKLDRLLPDTIILGRASPVITNPTTRDSEYIKDADKDESVIRESLLRRIRWRTLNKKKKTRVIIKPDMTKGAFPRSDEVTERMEHCRKAMRELNTYETPKMRAKAKKTLRVIRRVQKDLRTVRNVREGGI